ncbi:hypothetical protein HN51_008591 [Arachis hypogaea]|uniref:Avr9/Cf-9 rapidly elicited protein n=1 Tax=Arachis hypogaea TaxID=3818 RepID=A0A445D2V2_ARAHY|nr:uncharacterized protein LOC112803804 [Arachis hypogaea]QHO42920.1 uncharacterized protein DS421_5g158410 [Arachis hypogaea]RYR57538.1 hypothetical protein Ahy_A05g023249 [Arachis hypogaea]
MEIEARAAPMVAKKLLNILRIVMVMLRKGISKSKLISEFNLLLKRGKIAASNAISTTLTLHHHYAAAFTRHRSSFRNNKNLSFYPREYQFSCTSSPAFNYHSRRHHRCHHHEDVSTLCKVLEMLKDNNNNSNCEMMMDSPLMPLPGFGKSPKQLRITDSPFPLKDEEDFDDDDGGKIDIKAEEFIKRFYKNLHSQHTNSPYYYSWDR